MSTAATDAPPSLPPGGHVDEALLDAFARRATGDGASTLDMLKCPTKSQQDAGSIVRHVPSHVRDEMLLQARAGLGVQQSRATGKPVQNTTTLGERLDRPKERAVPGTPVTRKLRYGRLTRTDGKDDALFASRSAPTLPHPRRLLHDQLRLEALAISSSNSNINGKDVLDLALPAPSASKQQGGSEPEHGEGSNTRRLAQRRQQLEEELLHVTKKLNRKYTKQLFPVRSPSPSKIHSLATRWSAQEPAASESERYTMYMEGRYATQSQLDFYERDLEPRDATNNKHRHNAAHTKYGNALAANRSSLRGVF